MKQPKERLAVPGLSSWISLELRLSKYRDDPRRVILVANRPEKCQSERYDCACCDKSLSEQAQSARMSAWRESVLAANAKKGRKCEQIHTSHPQASILYWEAGLKPLYVGQVRVCDALDRRS